MRTLPFSICLCNIVKYYGSVGYVRLPLLSFKIVSFLNNWQPFTYVSVLKKEVIQSMDKTAQHNLSRSVSLMESLFKKLLKNEVRIEVLELITSKKETFLAVAQVFEKFNDKSIPLTSSALENIVSCREKDLKRLQEVITTVQKLHFFFREISESKLTLTLTISVFNNYFCTINVSY